MAIATGRQRRHTRRQGHSRTQWTLIVGDDSAFAGVPGDGPSYRRVFARDHQAALGIMRNGIAWGGWDAPAALPGLVVIEDGPYICADELLEAMRRAPLTRFLPAAVFVASTAGKRVAACFRAGASSVVCMDRQRSDTAQLLDRLESYWIGSIGRSQGATEQLFDLLDICEWPVDLGGV